MYKQVKQVHCDAGISNGAAIDETSFINDVIHRHRDQRRGTQGNNQCFLCMQGGKGHHSTQMPPTGKKQHRQPAAQHSTAWRRTTGHRRAKQAGTAPQIDSRAQQHRTTRKHSTKEHNTGKQGTTANCTKQREAGQRRDSHTDTKRRHQKTNTGHQTQHRTTAHQREMHNTQQRTTAPGASKWHAPQEQHNSSAPAPRSTATHKTERTGDTQQSTPGHTQHTAQRRTTACTNTPRQNTHSKEHTARGNTPKHGAAKNRTPGRQAAPEGTAPQATAPNDRNKTTQHPTAQHRAALRAAARSSTAVRDTQRSTAHGNADQNQTAKDTANNRSGRHDQRHGTSSSSNQQHSTTHKYTPQQAPHSVQQPAIQQGEASKQDTQHNTRQPAPQDTRQKGSAARQRQAAQGSTRAPGGGGQQKARTADERQARRQEQSSGKKRQSTEQQQRKPRHTKGTGGSNQKGAASGQAGNTKAARAHGEPSSRRPTKQTRGGGGGGKGWERKGGGAEKKDRRKKKGKRMRRKKTKKNPRGGSGGGDHTAPRPKAPGAGTQRKQETTMEHKGNDKKTNKENRKGATPTRRGTSKAERQSGQRKGEAHQNAPREAGPPDLVRKNEHTHTRTGLGRDVLRPTAGKKDATVTGSTHANHHSARSTRPTLQGLARENPIMGPRMGTMQSQPSAPFLARASGRHNEPRPRPASACPAQPPSKAGGASLLGGERYHGVGKANWSSESDETGGGAAHRAGPRGTLERHAAGHIQGTWTQTRSARTTRNEPQHKNRCQATPAAARMDVCAPGSEPSPCWLQNSRCLDQRVRARRVPGTSRLRTAAVRMNECAPGSVPSSCL